jgi:antitoxin CptB
MMETEMIDDARKKRLRYRAWHRGTKESDFILGSFADAHLPGMPDSKLDDFEALLDVPDPEIYDWVIGRADVPAEYDNAVVRDLLAHKITF